MKAKVVRGVGELNSTLTGEQQKRQDHHPRKDGLTLFKRQD